MMSHKKSGNLIRGMILISLLLTGCGVEPAQPTATLAPPTSTSIPATDTAVPSPTLPPTPTGIPASLDPMTLGDYDFQITEVRNTDTINNISGGPVSNYKGTMVMTANGFVPGEAQSGNKLLMVFIEIQSDNFQSFIDSDLQLIEEGSEESAVVILTQAEENRVIWVYDIDPASGSFLLVFPDGDTLDLGTITP